MALWIIFTLLGFTSNVYGWVKEMENPGLYEGDMILSPTQAEEVKKGTFAFNGVQRNRLWPKDQNSDRYVIPYELSRDLSSNAEFMSEFQHSIGEYHKYTCLQFKKRSYERAYIQFYIGGGCSSPVGYRGGKNTVSLSKGCWWRSTIMHEIGHSLGLHHEQSRSDRDRYVRILSHNVAGGTMHNFDKENDNSYNTNYDFWSMMHYSWDAFGGGRMTIQTRDPKYQYVIGLQDFGFSKTDVEQLNNMYPCQKKTTLPADTYWPTPSCHDLRGCGSHKFKGECSQRQWQTYLKGHCAKTCGFCTGTGTPVTVPPYTHGPITDFPPIVTHRPPPTRDPGCWNRVIDCHELGRHRCNDPRQVWRDYMRRSCKKYCNFC